MTYVRHHSILCLPDEVLGQSFLRLDWTDLIRVQGVCRRFRSVAGPESLAWASCCARRWAGPLNTALFEEKAVHPSTGCRKAPTVNWKHVFSSDNGWAAPQLAQQDISPSGQAAIGVSAMAVRPSGPEESMLAYSTAEELFCVKLGRSGRPERPHWRGRLAVSGAGAEQPSLPTALAVLDGSRGRLAVGSCGGGLSVCELTPQEPESVQDGPARHSTFWQAGRVPVTELHYLAAAGRLASLHSGMLTGAHVFLQEAGSLMLWDLDTQHCLLQAQDVLDGFRLVASVRMDEGGNELLAASYKLSDSQMLRGQCQLCPLETPTSLCFHKARISSAALCAFDARAPAGGMVQRFSTGHRSIYPRLQLVRQHFLVTSHAGTPVALWDRRHMNGPVHEVQHLPTHLDPPPPTPLPPCEDLPFNQGLHLHATQDLLVGRADNGMIWLWDLSERLGWADGSHPGTWLREATSAAAACAAEGTAAAHSDTAPGEHSLGAGQSDGQQHALGFQRQSLQSLHADERDYDRSPLPLGCLWPPEPVPCMGPQGDAQWVPLPELWVGHCWLAGLGCGEVCTEEEGPEGLPLWAPENTVFCAALTKP